jgi:hypothetical protein
MTSTATLGQLIDRHGVDVLDHLDRQLEVPVLDGLQFQGDLAIIPTAAPGRAAGAGKQTVPPAGIPVIPAVNGGHEHRLLADVPGSAYWRPATGGGQDLGVLHTTETAWLAHPEHGYLGIAPGDYVLRRQREQAEEERLVAD